jgi:N-acetylneuraminic acid mutarotase
MNTRRHLGVSLHVKLRLLLMVAMALAACTTVTEPKASTSTVAVSTTTTTRMTEDLPECRPGPPKRGIDLQYEEIIRLYEIRNPERLAELIGDGPVFDPSLEPEGPDLYPNLAAWLAAASRLTDQWSDRGYGFGEPFQLFLERRNPALREAGIDGLDITFEFWLTQDCELRVATTDIISAPDPCRYFELYDPEAKPEGCLGAFEPRASHAAVWSGQELLIYGGTSGADVVEPLGTGFAYDPAIDSWRDTSPSPVGISWWPDLNAFWTDDRLVVAGVVRDGQTYTHHLLTYHRETDIWEIASFPEEREQAGAVVWTGEELLSVGGDHNAPDDTAWSYQPESERWRQLPDPPIEPVEELRGVWAGDEAIFFGGYAGAQPSPAVAYDPKTDTWRSLEPAPGDWIQFHQLVWTGNEMIVYSGHTGPGHRDRLLLYHPATDSWSESSPMPMLPAERLAGAWTGDRLIIWGGYATYGEHDEDGDAVFGHGAMYDPITDTWELLPEAPISDRCDHSGTWTGEEFVVFGGMPLCGTPGVFPLGDAAAYDPKTDTWRLLEK